MIDFERSFAALFLGRPPLTWQTRLYRDWLRDGRIPNVVRLPTGLGKTSVIVLWLIATASGAPLPRRLVYIVNRRTVVDQATDDAKRLLGRIYRSGQRDRLSWATEKAISELGLAEEPALPSEHAPIVALLRDALRRLSGNEDASPLAVSTLRGELADNGEWKQDPARPAIIVGTIDMIGSKLLFSGYGDGRYGRAHHAGLIGQDTLVVHDEAHLSPAFSALLHSVETEQRRCKESRPIHVMELSATSRPDAGRSGANGPSFGIEREDLEDTVVKDRLTASKRLALRDAEKRKLVETIVGEATRLGKNPRRVLVYVRSPDTAAKIAAAITKKIGEGAKDRVRLLTGTIRGFERDELARTPLFKEFRSNPARTPLADALYLVSTSAGEVGADLDADDLVCDLTTLDSMAQRFGRVNRLGGEDRSAEVVVVREKTAEKDKAKKGGKEKKSNAFEDAVAKTGEILNKMAKSGGDVSPAALRAVLEGLSNDEQRAAFSPKPTILLASDILFDAWALTSIMGNMPGRPAVEPYLHGVADWEPPETHVAWRNEISELAKGEVSKDQLQDMLEAFPLLAVEQLKESTTRAVEQFVGIAEHHPDARAILIRNGEPCWVGLAELAPDKNDKVKLSEARRLLSFATVLLPADVGGLKDGALDGGTHEPVQDLAEATMEGQRDRQRVRVNGDTEIGLIVPEVAPLLRERCTLKVGDPGVEDEESPRPTIEYRVAKAESGEPGEPVGLAEHSKAVETAARKVGEVLALPREIVEALALAGRWHDCGKDHKVWQCYANNYRYGSTTNPAPPLAKAKKYGDARTILNGYRHEFGSLMEAVASEAASEEVRNHSECKLILHLIASHHGWARPHFKHDDGGRPGCASAYDPAKPVPKCGAAAADAMRRYAALQRRCGRWGLAWLESLLRAADVAASDLGGV